MKYFKLKKNRKNLDLTCPKKLIEQLTEPDITVTKATKIINELDNKIINELDNNKIEAMHKEIYNFLASLDEPSLLTIKTYVTRMEKKNDFFDKNFGKVFLMFFGTVVLSTSINIFSNLAVNDIKITTPFFEYTTKFINTPILIALVVFYVALFLFMTLAVVPSIRKIKLYSIHPVLINMLDFIIELKKADVNNNENIITTEVVEVTKMTENKARKETVKFRKENKEAPVNNTSAEK